MASFKDILNYYRTYWPIATISIGAASLCEILDLLVPYAIGQILNVLSSQPLDALVQQGVAGISRLLGIPKSQSLVLWVLLGVIFAVSVLRAPIQPWISSWFHWAIPLKARRDYAEQVLTKILTLPIAFYDQHNPGRIAGRVARGLTNHTWAYPEVAGQFIPKLVKVLGIFGVIVLIEWRIAIAFLLSFILILGFSFRNLKMLIRREAVLDSYMENTESRTSEIITNIKTVKAFATEARELERQRQRFLERAAGCNSTDSPRICAVVNLAEDGRPKLCFWHPSLSVEGDNAGPDFVGPLRYHFDGCKYGLR